jgi:hypothetical protein
MSDTATFKVFCIERYKSKHHLKGNEVFRLFKDYGVFDYIDSFYDVLHTFGEQYIIADINEFIAERQTDN